jgi:hypothetical protein
MIEGSGSIPLLMDPDPGSPKTYRSGYEILTLCIINCLIVPGELATADGHSALGEEEPHDRW